MFEAYFFKREKAASVQAHRSRGSLIKHTPMLVHMRVVSFVQGIFFKAKVDDVVKRFGSHNFCNDVTEIKDLQPNIIIVDLEHPNALAVLREHGRSVIAFGPHMRTDLLRIAAEFGARAYPRSIFFREIDHLLHLHE